MKHIFYLVLSIHLVWFGCEQNPIMDDEIKSPDRTISGKVVFNRATVNPEGIFVWLDGFDMFTYTDALGGFKFLLPPPVAQANPKGMSGAYKLYYYVSNFELESTSVFMRNGNFLYSGSEFNADGELIQDKMLNEKLETLIHIQPSSVLAENINVAGGLTDFLLRVDVVLRTHRDSVVVYYPGIFNNTYGPLIFRNIETNEVQVLSSAVTGINSAEYDTIDTHPQIRTMAVPIFPEDLGKGTFEIIPFIRIQDPELPEGIRRELELDTVTPGSDYMKIPYVRSGVNRYFTLE